VPFWAVIGAVFINDSQVCKSTGGCAGFVPMLASCDSCTVLVALVATATAAAADALSQLLRGCSLNGLLLCC